jgi:hypothetical protein
MSLAGGALREWAVVFYAIRWRWSCEYSVQSDIPEAATISGPDLMTNPV